LLKNSLGPGVRNIVLAKMAAAAADKTMEHGIELLDSAFVSLGLMPPKGGDEGQQTKGYGGHGTRYTGDSTSYDLNGQSYDTMSLGVPKLIQFDYPRGTTKRKEDELSDVTLENRKPARPETKARSLSLGNIFPFAWSNNSNNGDSREQENAPPLDHDGGSLKEGWGGGQDSDSISFIQKLKARGNNGSRKSKQHSSERSIVQRIKSMKKLRKRNNQNQNSPRSSPREADELQHTISILNKNYEEAVERNSPHKGNNSTKHAGGWFRGAAGGGSSQEDNNGESSPPKRVPTETSNPSLEGTASRASAGSQERRGFRLKARRLSFTSSKPTKNEESFSAPLIIVGEEWENPP